MLFDPENPIVKLCAQGMLLETEGKPEEANKLFELAWNQASNNIEAFTAAHYLARNQTDAEVNLKWNLVALEKAITIENEQITGVLPSLYLNTGKSHENLGHIPEAQALYQRALECSSYLPEGPYGDMIMSGITAALERTGQSVRQSAELLELIHAWCERKELKPLAFVLPAFVTNTGTSMQNKKLLSALNYLIAARSLNPFEQDKLEKIAAVFTLAINDEQQKIL